MRPAVLSLHTPDSWPGACPPSCHLTVMTPHLYLSFFAGWPVLIPFFNVWLTGLPKNATQSTYSPAGNFDIVPVSTGVEQCL